MKVWLFNPPSPSSMGYTREGRCTQEAGAWATQWPPISLACVATLLLEDGHEVKVKDYSAVGQNASALYGEIQIDRPDIALWSTGTPTFSFDLKLAGGIKSVSPATRTGVLGTHVSFAPEEAFQEAEIDFVIRHEPEAVIRNLCRREGASPKTVAGLSFRDGKNRPICHNPSAPFLDADSIPMPAWDLLDLDPYRLPLKGRNFLMVAPMRGCPYRCSFCTASLYYGESSRYRPVENVLVEVMANVHRHRIREFLVWADTFTLNRRYVRQFCQGLLEQQEDLSWTCNSRVDTVDPETLKIMKKAGLWMISYGIESGNNAILKRSGKGITVEQTKNAVQMAKEAGLRVAGHFILGLPGETEETLNETLALALTLPLDVAQFYAAVPFPGTRLYEEALSCGWLKTAFGHSQNHASLELPDLPSERVEAFRRYAYSRFYRRPRVWGNLLSMIERGAFRDILLSLKRFSSWAGD
ncbi:MAG: Oxygen-independent coproporphyrinogen-III oxidase 1 [Syntrophus sp. PtaU1.Bin208]|nr:MAG: Oxygen-independent coproporphyrinogen-III oxidase 1 [Syntrophus sp. PtaU1.Bin208]